MALKTDNSIRNAVAIREALRHVCDRGELLLLVTPYVRFESNFLRLDQDAVQVTALMSREDAMFGLRSPDLRMRFPYGHKFFEAGTKLQGIGMTRGRQSLTLAIPALVQEDDYRGAYRVERVGRMVATFSSRKYELLMANVVNISTTGVRIFSQRDFEDGEVLVDDLVHIAVSVTPEIKINCKAKVRFVKERILGLEFRPLLDGPLLDDFARWVFQKQEEELVLAAGRARNEEGEAPGSEPGSQPEVQTMVLVSSSEELELRLREMLKDFTTLSRVPPSTQAMKDLAGRTSTLVLFHAAGLSFEERKRMRILLDALGGKVPFVLLGTDVDSGALFELGNELKAVNAYQLGPTSTGFFPRLLRGILRKLFG